MEREPYFKTVKARFSAEFTAAEILESTAETFSAYEAVFKWKWFATKLKMTSFLKYMPSVDEQTLRQYSTDCLNSALKNNRGLPRGVQNGIVSFSVLASEQVSPEAIAFAEARPKKHYSAFEFPVVVDFSNDTMYYHKDPIIWGTMYTAFMKAYLEEHFSPAP